MIKVVVVDRHAEARNRAYEKLTKLLLQAEDEAQFLPRISFKQLSLEELKFHRAPDLCVVGPELTRIEPHEITAIKKHLPHTPLLVWTEGPLDIYRIEQLARHGADDILNDETTAEEFYKKIILLSRRTNAESIGKLIVVDGAKGGVGITSMTASLAELLSENGKSVCLVDGDVETQDLTRFLQVKPFINENLKLLFDGQRPISEESVQQCLIPLWDGLEHSAIMPPVPDSDDLLDSTSVYVRSFLSVLEILNERYEYVLVDSGCLRGLFWKALIRAADSFIFITNNDPASLFASVNKIVRAKGLLSSGSDLHVCLNAVAKQGLPAQLFMEEASRAARLESEEWAPVSIPYCAQGMKWPGSDATFYTLAQKSARAAIDGLAQRLEFIEVQRQTQVNLLQQFTQVTRSVKERLLPAKTLMAQPAPLLVSTTPQISGNTRALPQLPEPSEETYSPELFFTPAEISSRT